MRKCPNCKKAVPVGARRCVHCRSLVGDASVDLDNLNATTRMGTNSKNSSPYGHAESGRKFNDFQDQSNAHHTMIGLGPIAASPARRSSEDLSRNFGQQTIAGMPGISFEPHARQGGYRMAAASARTPARGLAPVKDNADHIHSNPHFSQQEIPHTETVVGKQSPFFNMPEKQNIYANNGQNVPTQAPQAFQEPEEDALAGLPGVSVVPSSLVDEEFDDLTSKLFGDDFVIDEEEEDEEGLDFDVPTDPTPIKPVTTQPVITQPKPTANIAAVQPVTKRQEFKPNSQPVKKIDPNAQMGSKNEKNIQIHKTFSLFDKIIIGATGASVLFFVLWIIIALTSSQDAANTQGSNLPAIILVVLNIAGSGVCTLRYKSLKPMHIMAIVAILTVALFIAMVAGGADSRIFLLLGMLCQTICVGTCFLKY